MVLCRFVQQCLDVRWSPEQISYALGVEFPHEPARQLAPESLYQALYASTRWCSAGSAPVGGVAGVAHTAAPTPAAVDSPPR